MLEVPALETMAWRGSCSGRFEEGLFNIRTFCALETLVRRYPLRPVARSLLLQVELSVNSIHDCVKPDIYLTFIAVVHTIAR